MRAGAILILRRKLQQIDRDFWSRVLIPHLRDVTPYVFEPMEAEAGKDQDRATRDAGGGRPQYPAPNRD
jgi:hypothetical protein